MVKVHACMYSELTCLGHAGVEEHIFSRPTNIAPAVGQPERDGCHLNFVTYEPSAW